VAVTRLLAVIEWCGKKRCVTNGCRYSAPLAAMRSIHRFRRCTLSPVFYWLHLVCSNCYRPIHWCMVSKIKLIVSYIPPSSAYRLIIFWWTMFPLCTPIGLSPPVPYPSSNVLSSNEVMSTSGSSIPAEISFFNSEKKTRLLYNSTCLHHDCSLRYDCFTCSWT